MAKDVDAYIERLNITMPTQRTFELVCEIREMLEHYFALQQRVQKTENTVREITIEREKLKNQLAQAQVGSCRGGWGGGGDRERSAKPRSTRTRQAQGTKKGAVSNRAGNVSWTTVPLTRRNHKPPQRYGRSTDEYDDEDEDEYEEDNDDDDAEEEE